MNHITVLSCQLVPRILCGSRNVKKWINVWFIVDWDGFHSKTCGLLKKWITEDRINYMTIFVLSELIRICFAPAGSGGSPTGGGGNRSRDRLKEGLHEVFASRDQCCWCHILCRGQHRGPGQLCLLWLVALSLVSTGDHVKLVEYWGLCQTCSAYCHLIMDISLIFFTLGSNILILNLNI